MGFNATIQDLGNERLELIATVMNHSAEVKTLSNIDIDNGLHKKLDLHLMQGSIGEYIPIDNTISYPINKRLAPGQIYTFRLRGTKAALFITGDIDFIINGDNLSFRSFPVSCCH